MRPCFFRPLLATARAKPDSACAGLPTHTTMTQVEVRGAYMPPRAGRARTNRSGEAGAQGGASVLSLLFVFALLHPRPLWLTWVQ